MGSRYKFNVIDPVEVGGEKCFSFALSSRTGMTWEGYIKPETMTIKDDKIVPGAGIIKMDIEFTKGKKCPIPVHGMNLINYKISQMLRKGMHEMIRMKADGVKKFLNLV